MLVFRKRGAEKEYIFFMDSVLCRVSLCLYFCHWALFSKS